MSAELLILESESARVTVDLAHGARLASLQVLGLELLIGPDHRGPMEWGCFPMAPWVNRIRHGLFSFDGRTYELPCNLGPNAIHGTVFDRPWTADGDGVASTALGDPWPFPGRVVQRFTLRPDHLRLDLEVHATDGPMPASCGWHPWFRRALARGRPGEAAFDAVVQYDLDHQGIPTGSTSSPRPGPWDDCFGGLLRPPQVRWPGALALTLESDCDYLMVFDRPTEAVCVEPQTAPPDAVNHGWAVVVEPGRPLVASLTLRWQAA